MSTSDHRQPDDDRLTLPMILTTIVIVVLAYSGEWIGPLFR